LTERNERLEATFSARLDSIIYAAQSSMNSLDQGYRGKASYRLSPRVNLETGAEFVQDSRADRDIGMSGLAILETFNAVKLDRTNYSLTGSYALNETTTANLSYNFGSDRYHDPKFTDITSHAVTLGLDHDLGRLVPNIKGGLTAGFTRYLFISSVVDNYTLAAGLQGELNELWTVSASLGGRLTQSMIETTSQVEFYPSFRSVTLRTVDTNPGWIGQLALAYHGEQSSGRLTYYRDVTSASGRSGTAERNALVLDVGRRFSYGLWGNLTAAVYLNQSEQRQFSNQPIDETTIDINPGLRYEFTKDMDLRADYHFQRVDSRQSSGGGTVDRNSVLLTFTYRYPFLE
jgi:predicted porin